MADTSLELTSARTPHVADGLLLVLPLGSTEQHGPHLPLGTDSVIAGALATALGTHLGPARAAIAPVLPFGSSGEHAGFAGTLSIGTEALTHVVVEVVRSATSPGGGPFDAVLLVSGHGGNADGVRAALELLQAEGRRVAGWSPAIPSGDAHAGRTETSLMLHLAPDLVDVASARAGATAPLGGLLPELRRGGVRAVSPNGVLGDPTGATADEGRVLFERLVRDLVAAAAALTGGG